ncbi:hypothetical protein T10_8848 [Trichinella papuae]|uniref:Uncharacterized protein n=1 Tax=Trichinella papuae TaxID=268474 RepID=A0A0V1MFM6_9BILA|nr:hypothetical protein T10_8848 [Trichinella papuae]
MAFYDGNKASLVHKKRPAKSENYFDANKLAQLLVLSTFSRKDFLKFHWTNTCPAVKFRLSWAKAFSVHSVQQLRYI